MRKGLSSAALVPVVLLAGLSLAGGTWVDTTFVPPSLGFSNQVRIYLPEGYDPQGTVDYPTIYWLHGWNVMGGPGHTMYSAMTLTALDSLITSGQIDPVIVVKPNGTCPPYNGSAWANSVLYGNYEDYVVFDLVDFMEQNYCVCTEPWKRCIAGHSMGGTGSMDLALRHPDRYRAVAAHSGIPDFKASFDLIISEVIEECPESEPPYTYDWGNGFYTDFMFVGAGAFSPNLSAPDSVDYLLDPEGEIIDTVYALWELHNAAHMIKLIPSPDLAIFLDVGDNDDISGIYEANCGFSDTLTMLGIEHTFHILPGVNHYMNLDRFIEAFLFLDLQMTGIEGDPVLTASVLYPPRPNPFSSATAIRFELPVSSPTRIDVYDITGRLVDTLMDGMMTAGMHSVEFDGSGLVSGVYLVRLTSGSECATAKVVLVR